MDSVERAKPNHELIGRHVRVKKTSKRLGGALYPGRIGVVSGINGCDENLIYIDLEPTERAKARTVALWLCDLIFRDED